MLKNVDTKIISNRKIAECIYEMVLHCPDADLEHFVPGQFANIEIPNRNDLLLKRPFSINKVDNKEKRVTIIYQLVGEGTNSMAELKPNESIKAILPVGRGFHLTSEQKDIVLVGGGVGIAPLYTVIKRWPDKNYDIFLGYRSIEHAYCINDFEEVCSDVCVTSDDGTVGEMGIVTKALSERLKKKKPDVILTCGPVPMLKSLKDIVGDVPVQVSLEQRMGCGFGACAACVCGIKKDEDTEYKKVCIEGPVFDLAEVQL